MAAGSMTRRSAKTLVEVHARTGMEHLLTEVPAAPYHSLPCCSFFALSKPPLQDSGSTAMRFVARSEKTVVKFRSKPSSSPMGSLKHV